MRRHVGRGVPPSAKPTGRARQSGKLTQHSEYDIREAAIVCCWYRIGADGTAIYLDDYDEHPMVCGQRFTSVRAYEQHAADHQASGTWRKG